MIALIDNQTGLFSIVEALEGNDLEGRIAIDLPADWGERPYRLAGTAFVLDLAAIKATRWRAVRAAQEVAEWGGCETPLGRVDTDPDSQRKVVGADRMAEKLGPAFTIGWTMADDSIEVHDADAMSAMALAVGLHVSACHAEGAARRAAIDAAQDEAAIEAVPVEGGWPGA